MRNLTMMTDLYQLTMMYGYYKFGMTKNQAVFDVFFRTNMPNSGYTIMAGLDTAIDYIKNIRLGIEEKHEEIDAIIEKNLKNWKIERISKVNLAILRIAVYEMKYVDDVPDKVALNEAIEICKKYSDEKSVSFVNGVLDAILKSM